MSIKELSNPFHTMEDFKQGLQNVCNSFSEPTSEFRTLGAHSQVGRNPTGNDFTPSH